MLDFFRAGGFSMIFVLMFGALAVAAAARFGLRPDARRVDAVRALTLATLLSVGSGTFSDIAAVCSKVPERFADHPKIHLVVMEGIGESMSPGILGFSLLSVAWLIMAVGHRRLRALLPA